MKKIKNFKVYQGFGRNYVEVPMIRLQGKWLGDLGFTTGDQIIVTCNEDNIIISKCEAVMDNENMETGFAYAG